VPSSEYNVNIIISTRDKTSQAAKAATSSLGQLKQAVHLVAAAWAALRTAQKLIDFVKLGGQVERAGRAFESLAKSAGTSGDVLLKTIQQASDYTIDNMAAMSAANKALIMGVAETPAQFEELATVAVRLGRAMGLDAATSMDRFTVAAARQSVKIADDLGLMIDASIANEKYAKTHNLIAESLTGAQQAQAFLNEMLDQGKTAVEKLGPSVIGTAEKIDILTSAWKNLRDQVALAVAEGTLAPVGGLEAMGRWAAESAERFERAQRMTYAQPQAGLFGMPSVSVLNQYATEQIAVEAATRRAAAAMNEQNNVASIAVPTLQELYEKSHLVTASEEELAAAEKLVTEAHAQAESIWETRLWFLERESQATRDAILAEREHVQALYSTSVAMMDLAASYSAYLGQISMSGIDYAGSMEEIEARYQKSIKSITGSAGGGAGGGAAAARDFDRADIERGLRIQQLQLEEYEKQWSEFGKVTEKTEPVFWYELSREDRKWLIESGKTLDDLRLKREQSIDETTDLERAQMDDRIEDLKREIGETQRILKQGHWDQSQIRVAAAQRDTAALLAEAATRREKEIAALEKSQAQQEEMNRESLGRIKLAAFDNWVSMNIDTDNMTREQAIMIAGMRQSIMLEYGLLTTEAIQATRSWERAFDDLWETLLAGAKDAVTELDKVIAKLDEMPDEKRIKIIYELANRPEDIPGRQHGGPVQAGMPYIVGEPYGELFVPGSSGHIYNNTRTEQMIGSHNTYNITDPRGMAFLGAAERAAARNAYARASGM